MKKYFLILTLFCSQIFAQSNLNFEFDYAQFKYDSTSNLLEIYYSIYSENGGSENSDLIMLVQLQNKITDELVINKNWMVNNSKNGTSDPAAKNLLGTIAFVVKSGDYNLTISVSPKGNEANEKEYKEAISIKPFEKRGFSISDIELASRIVNDSADKNSIFYKNTLEVYPNPAILYSNTLPVLFYYCELYNLAFAEADKLELSQAIYNSKNRQVFNKIKQVKKSNNALVDINAINLQKFPTDTYTLVLTLKDIKTQKTTVSGKKFFLVNPDVVAEKRSSDKVSSYISSEFGVLSEEECDDLFKKSKIIAVENEIDQYNSLDSLSGKRDFLYKFWLKRDNDPTTPQNEYKNEYFKRVKIANAQYKTMSSEGYATDRGRIFLKLGEPDEIERHPNETNSKPYEIWIYHQIQGGVQFIFGDVTGFNFYELLHSTMRGELQDPQWFRRLQRR